MKTRTIWIPARSREIAHKVANAVQIGKVPCLSHYLDEARANAAAANLAALHADRGYRAHCFVLETRTVDDGRIFNVWPVNKVGDVASALLIVIGGCWAVGWGTLL